MEVSYLMLYSCGKSESQDDFIGLWSTILTRSFPQSLDSSIVSLIIVLFALFSFFVPIYNMIWISACILCHHKFLLALLLWKWFYAQVPPHVFGGIQMQNLASSVETTRKCIWSWSARITIFPRSHMFPAEHDLLSGVITQPHFVTSAQGIERKKWENLPRTTKGTQGASSSCGTLCVWTTCRSATTLSNLPHCSAGLANCGCGI